MAVVVVMPAIVVMAFVFVLVVMVAMAMSAVAVPMPMPARGVSTVFGLKTFVHRMHDQMHRAQHVGQHMVGLDLQVVRLQFYGHKPAAQVICFFVSFHSEEHIGRRCVPNSF